MYVSMTRLIHTVYTTRFLWQAVNVARENATPDMLRAWDQLAARAAQFGLALESPIRNPENIEYLIRIQRRFHQPFLNYREWWRQYWRIRGTHEDAPDIVFRDLRAYLGRMARADLPEWETTAVDEYVCDAWAAFYHALPSPPKNVPPAAPSIREMNQ